MNPVNGAMPFSAGLRIVRGGAALVPIDIGLPCEDGFALARWQSERSARLGWSLKF